MRVPSRGWQQLLIMEGDSTKLAKAAAPAKENGNHALCAVTARGTCAHGPLDADACVRMTHAIDSNCWSLGNTFLSLRGRLPAEWQGHHAYAASMVLTQSLRRFFPCADAQRKRPAVAHHWR